MTAYITPSIDHSLVGASVLNWYTNSGQKQIIRCDSIGIFNDTSSSAANCRITSTPTILRSTASSIKIKKDVEDLWDSQADLVLQLRPVKYFSKKVENVDIRIKHYGFIAEEVALIDPRLVDWRFTRVLEDQWGNNGELIYEELENPEPEGVDYCKIPILLTNIVKRQKNKIKSLHEKIATAEILVEQLERAVQ